MPRHIRLPTLIVYLSVHVGHALFPYGPAAGDIVLTSERSPLINVSPAFPFYGLSMSSVMIYRNAFISFDDTERDYYLLDKDSMVNFPVISSWASEIRPAHNKGSGTISYRLTTNDTELDQLARVARNFSDFSRSFYPRYILVVTWYSVGTVHYDAVKRNRTNTFQTVLASDGQESLVWMEYVQVQWIYDGTGVLYDYVDSIDTAYFTRAQVGFYKGDTDNTKFLLPASFTASIRHITADTNVNRPGLFIFRVDRAPTNLTAYTDTRSSTTTSPTTNLTTYTETRSTTTTSPTTNLTTYTETRSSTTTSPTTNLTTYTETRSTTTTSPTTQDETEPTASTRIRAGTTTHGLSGGDMSGPIVGMSVAACAVLSLTAVSALVLVFTRKNWRRNKKLKSNRVSPESPALDTKGNGPEFPLKSQAFKIPRLKLYSDKGVVSSGGSHVVEY